MPPAASHSALVRTSQVAFTSGWQQAAAGGGQVSAAHVLPAPWNAAHAAPGASTYPHWPLGGQHAPTPTPAAGGVNVTTSCGRCESAPSRVPYRFVGDALAS